jgi:hypothetical protein
MTKMRGTEMLILREISKECGAFEDLCARVEIVTRDT